MASPRRLALGIEYDGSAYSGWQVQPHSPSIQAALESALSFVAAAPVALICAGRTDAGVHAGAQVAHFDTCAARRVRSWVLGANSQLPADISVRWVQPVSLHFHARYSALSRTYRYWILNRAARSALVAARALPVHAPLALEPMRSAAASLLGEHDFSAFRSVECQARSPVRALRRITIERRGDWICIEMTANAFLHHMARNIVGLLLSIGLGRAPVEEAVRALESRVRSGFTVTAAACGLYLWRVEYPPQFGLPPDSDMINAPAGRPVFG